MTQAEWGAATDELFEAIGEGYGIDRDHAKGLAFRVLTAAARTWLTPEPRWCTLHHHWAHGPKCFPAQLGAPVGETQDGGTPQCSTGIDSEFCSCGFCMLVGRIQEVLDSCEAQNAKAIARAALGRSVPQDELEKIRATVLAICDEPEDEETPYVIIGESGMPIVEADSLSDAVAQIITCWNDVETRMDTLGGRSVPQELADTLHWLRSELCDIAGITVGDDQYPWKAIVEALRGRSVPAEPTPPPFDWAFHEESEPHATVAEPTPLGVQICRVIGNALTALETSRLDADTAERALTDFVRDLYGRLPLEQQAILRADPRLVGAPPQGEPPPNVLGIPPCPCCGGQGICSNDCTVLGEPPTP